MKVCTAAAESNAAHQQARQLSAALPAGGGGTNHRAMRSRLASPVSAPGDATGTTDRQGRDGPQASRSTLLDVAQGMGLRTVEKARFVRGRARKSPGCAIDHRRNDWASRSAAQGSSK